MLRRPGAPGADEIRHPFRKAARMPQPTATVSVVVINLNGRDFLEACLQSVLDQDYPQDQIELVVIDNASTDGSVEMIRERFPSARLEVNDRNLGFAPVVNQGARLATGTYLALLNNDAVADPGWVREAVRVLEIQTTAGCVASKMLREDRETVDYAGGQMAFYGHGFAKGNREPDDPDDHGVRPTLFASGGAMIVRRDFFLRSGGFDDSYFAFFEDVDFGWRTWLLGSEVLYVPASKVYHRHHGTIERFGYPRERYLLERNALATIFKNYGDESLARALPGSVALTMLRGLHGEDSLPDYRIGVSTEPIEDVQLSALAGAHLAAVRDWGLGLGELGVKRHWVQTHRKVDDRKVLPLFEQALLPNVPHADYIQVFAYVVDAFGLKHHFRGRPRVLIITADTLSRRMAGPAIRCWEMARLLSAEHEVTLASTRTPELEHADFTVTSVQQSNIDALLAGADVVIIQGFIMYLFPQIAASDVPVVVDIYDPFHLEGLQLRKNESATERFSTARSDADVLNAQLRRGDFFVCASDKQRDFWLGQMSGLYRVNPATFDQDESLRALLDVAPFGLPSEAPQRRGPAFRGVVDGIGEDDFVLLWGGGIYNWFDPLSLIRAVGAVAEEHDDVKLFFLGKGHPNPDVPAMRMAAQALELAEELGLLGRHVFFNDHWVDYDRRADYLLEADVGVSTHFEHIETAFSYRTRILDYLWAGLPVLATEGDSLSRMIDTYGFGVTVPPEDVGALASAIKRLRNDANLYDSAKKAAASLAPEMTWDRALAPIVAFCRNPRRAADVVPSARPYVDTDALRGATGAVGTAKRLVRYYRSTGSEGISAHARRFLELTRTIGWRRTAAHTKLFITSKLGRL